MAPQEWSFKKAIEELQRSSLHPKRKPIALRVPHAKIRADLRWVVECYFDNKKSWGLAPTTVKEKYGSLLGDLDQTRAKLSEIFGNSNLLKPLTASDKDYQGTSYSCQRLLGTFDRLHDRVKAADRVAASRVRSGRIKSSHRETLFLDLCGRYEKYTGRTPGRTIAHGHGRDAGPFARFATAVFEEIEPEEAKTAKLASAISQAITKWKTAKGRKGKKYDYGFNR